MTVDLPPRSVTVDLPPRSVTVDLPPRSVTVDRGPVATAEMANRALEEGVDVDDEGVDAVAAAGDNRATVTVLWRLLQTIDR